MCAAVAYLYNRSAVTLSTQVLSSVGGKNKVGIYFCNKEVILCY